MECLLDIAGVLTGVVCWELGVDTAPDDDTGTLDMDMDMMLSLPVLECRRGVLGAEFLKSDGPDLGRDP